MERSNTTNPLALGKPLGGRDIIAELKAAVNELLPGWATRRSDEQAPAGQSSTKLLKAVGESLPW